MIVDVKIPIDHEIVESRTVREDVLDWLNRYAGIRCYGVSSNRIPRFNVTTLQTSGWQIIPKDCRQRESYSRNVWCYYTDDGDHDPTHLVIRFNRKDRAALFKLTWL